MAEDALTSPIEDEETKQIADPAEDKPDADQQDEDVEIVLEGDDGSQPKPQQTGGGYNRLIRRLKAAKTDTKETSAALAASEEKNKLLELALAQAKDSANEPPDPSSFDGGAADPQYVRAVQTHTQEMVDRAVEKATANIPTPTQPNIDLDRKQVQHCERADKLGIADYDDVQDKAIEILGHGTVNEIIAKSDKSEVIVYHLGKNPAIAEDLRDLIATDPVRAAIEIGRLEEKLKIRPRATTQSTPDPDVEVQGGTPTAGQANKFQKRLDKAREAATETGAMRAVLAIKKEAREAGVAVT